MPQTAKNDVWTAPEDWQQHAGHEVEPLTVLNDTFPFYCHTCKEHVGWRIVKDKMVMIKGIKTVCTLCHNDFNTWNIPTKPYLCWNCEHDAR